MLTYRITTRELTGGLIGVTLAGFRNGQLATRINVAAVLAVRLDSLMTEMRAGLNARGILDEDTLTATRRPRPDIAFA